VLVDVTLGCCCSVGRCWLLLLLLRYVVVGCVYVVTFGLLFSHCFVTYVVVVAVVVVVVVVVCLLLLLLLVLLTLSTVVTLVASCYVAYICCNVALLLLFTFVVVVVGVYALLLLLLLDVVVLVRVRFGVEFTHEHWVLRYPTLLHTPPRWFWFRLPLVTTVRYPFTLRTDVGLVVPCRVEHTDCVYVRCVPGFHTLFAHVLVPIYQRATTLYHTLHTTCIWLHVQVGLRLVTHVPFATCGCCHTRYTTRAHTYRLHHVYTCALVYVVTFWFVPHVGLFGCTPYVGLPGFVWVGWLFTLLHTHVTDTGYRLRVYVLRCVWLPHRLRFCVVPTRIAVTDTTFPDYTVLVTRTFTGAVTLHTDTRSRLPATVTHVGCSSAARTHTLRTTPHTYTVTVTFALDHVTAVTHAFTTDVPGYVCRWIYTHHGRWFTFRFVGPRCLRYTPRGLVYSCWVVTTLPHHTFPVGLPHVYHTHVWLVTRCCLGTLLLRVSLYVTYVCIVVTTLLG